MYQIDVATASSTLPVPAAAGTPGYFTDGNLAEFIEPTIVPADFFNTIMLELLNVLVAAGVVPSKVQQNQLLLSIETLIEARSGNYLVDTGGANAYLVAASPPITSYADGLQIRVKIAHGNTGASHLDAGAGAEPIVREDGVAVGAGDLPAGYIVTFNYSAGAAAWQIAGLVPSQFGTAARAAASSLTGTVSAVSGATVASRLSVFTDAAGTVATGPAVSSATGVVAAVQGSGTIPVGSILVAIDEYGTAGGSGTVITNLNSTTLTIANNGATLQPGNYQLDTRGGPLTFNLSATLAGSYLFSDPVNNWSVNAATLVAQGTTQIGKPGKSSASFPLNVSNKLVGFSADTTNNLWRGN